MPQNATLTGTATAAGTSCTIQVQGQGLGSLFAGTVSVPNSPAGTRWLVAMGGTKIATIVGSSQYGPFALTPSTGVTVSSTGPTLVNGKQYTATVVGRLYTTGTPRNIPIPQPAAMSVTEVTLKGGTIDVGTVSTIKVVESITAGNVTAGVINQTGTVIETSGSTDYLGTIATTSGNPASKVFALTKSYDAIEVRAGFAGSGTAYCMVVTPTPTGSPSPVLREAAFAITPISVAGTYQAVVPVALKKGGTTRVTIYMSAAAPIGSHAYVFGITGNTSNVQLRSDGRAYPIGSHGSSVTTTALGTTTIVSAPTSPLRLLVKSVSMVGGHTSSGVGFGYVAGSINGVSPALAGGTLGPTMGFNVFAQTDSGWLLDAGTALVCGLQVGSATNVIASAVYDIVV